MAFNEVAACATPFPRYLLRDCYNSNTRRCVSDVSFAWHVTSASVGRTESVRPTSLHKEQQSQQQQGPATTQEEAYNQRIVRDSSWLTRIAWLKCARRCRKLKKPSLTASAVTVRGIRRMGSSIGMIYVWSHERSMNVRRWACGGRLIAYFFRLLKAITP